MSAQPDGAAKTALIVRGGWDGHQPVETTDSVIPFLEGHGFEVEVSDTAAVYADAERMAGVDLIVQSTTMSTIEKEEVAGLRAAVAAGTGLAGWHGGIADAYRASADYLQLIGGQFAHHPGKEPGSRIGEASDNYLAYSVDMTELGRTHSITAGLDDFTLVTEQYWVLGDDYNEVLATTTLAARSFDPWLRPVTCPAVWTRRWGAGRVFVCTPGHTLEVLDDENVRTIIERGLLWASR